MEMVGEVQEELADPIKIDRRVAEGPLGRERKKCDFAKRAIAYARVAGRAEVHAADLREAGAAGRAGRLR